MVAIKKKEPMISVGLKIPKEWREKIRQIVESHEAKGENISEADVFRTAIEFFLDANFTDSKESEDVK